MAEKIRKGLLAIWVHCESDYRTEFQKWQNCEHIPERVSIPGFLVGFRYQRFAGTVDFMMCYETDDASIMESEPYLAAVNRPSPWTKETMSHSRVIARSIYQQLSFVGENPPTEAPYMIARQFDVDPESEGRFLEWNAEEQLPGICKVPGVYNGAIYALNEKISHIQTTERKIHGGGPGQRKFLALYRTASPDVPESVAWRELDGRDKDFGIQAVEDERYWLDFVLYH
jgi:hypothetical protein